MALQDWINWQVKQIAPTQRQTTELIVTLVFVPLCVLAPAFCVDVAVLSTLMVVMVIAMVNVRDCGGDDDGICVDLRDSVSRNR
ncbi:hypothetical protein O3P69_000438 [Scylla paramamosain]|uniref:Uncharacterized protein n=1 Tax=Scylla paramamosain TaxID=85552 RepID=A0AAW0UT56_SCYPA